MRNIWRLYGGWYDGNPAHLKPAPAARARRASSRRSPAARAGSRTGRASSRAAGDLRLAGHLAELAAQAAPDDAGVHAARAEVFGARAPTRRRRRWRRASSRWAEHESQRDEEQRVKIDGTNDPGHRRVVGHRRRARADPRRQGATVGIVARREDRLDEVLAAVPRARARLADVGRRPR